MAYWSYECGQAACVEQPARAGAHEVKLHLRQPATASDAILQDGVPDSSGGTSKQDPRFVSRGTAESDASHARCLRVLSACLILVATVSRPGQLGCEARVDEFAKYVNMVRDMDPQCKEDSSASVVLGPSSACCRRITWHIHATSHAGPRAAAIVVVVACYIVGSSAFACTGLLSAFQS